MCYHSRQLSKQGGDLITSHLARYNLLVLYADERKIINKINKNQYIEEWVQTITSTKTVLDALNKAMCKFGKLMQTLIISYIGKLGNNF